MNLALLVALTLQVTEPTPTPMTPAEQNAAYAAEVTKQIEGKEQLQAAEVFKNIQVMKNVTAGRLLNIMRLGYARSLGVTCDHCHTPGKWEDDSKAPKHTARDMIKMVGTINRELLANIVSLKDRDAHVNCTTCHRGDVKPALDLPEATKP